MSRITVWEPDLEIHGYTAALVAADGSTLFEAAITVGEDDSAAFDIIGQDGQTVIARGGAATIKEAMAAAEEAMKLH